MNPTLFDVLPPKRAATLEETRLRDQQVRVLVALAGMPEGAHTAYDLQAWLTARGEDRGIQRNAVSSRFRELARDYGFVARVGSRRVATGRSESTFRVTAEGAAWVRSRS